MKNSLSQVLEAVGRKKEAAEQFLAALEHSPRGDKVKKIQKYLANKKKQNLLGPYSGPMRRALWWSYGGGLRAGQPLKPWSQALQGYLAHKKPPSPLGSPPDATHRSAVGS